MASAGEEIDVPFVQALKAAFSLNERKIISAVSFDVIGMIPHLSEGDIMEPNLRKLLIERNLVSAAKSLLVLHRIHEMGAYGYVRFVVLLQKNSSNIVYRKLAEQLLATAQELYTACRWGLCSCHHLYSCQGDEPMRRIVVCSSGHNETPSVTRGTTWTPGENASVQPDSCQSPDTLGELPQDTLCRHHPAYQQHLSLHATSHQSMPARDAIYCGDVVSPSVMRFTEENVFVLVQQFCKSGGSQMEKVGTEKTFRTLMQQAKSSVNSRTIVNKVKVYKCVYLAEVLVYYHRHGMRTAQCVHITERLADLVSSIDADTLSPSLTASLLKVKDKFDHIP